MVLEHFTFSMLNQNELVFKLNSVTICAKFMSEAAFVRFENVFSTTQKNGLQQQTNTVCMHFK